mmetsp:Transcript_32348/g.52108  ORF Transcript_32348/g.52108 Transcript_32348/m.52108 type:complete len:239 (-) Transcript_32348:859-1575(-)
MRTLLLQRLLFFLCHPLHLLIGRLFLLRLLLLILLLLLRRQGGTCSAWQRRHAHLLLLPSHHACRILAFNPAALLDIIDILAYLPGLFIFDALCRVGVTACSVGLSFALCSVLLTSTSPRRLCEFGTLLHFEGGVEITHTVGNIFDTACEDIPVLDARNACELLCVRGKPCHVVLRLQLISLAAGSNTSEMAPVNPLQRSRHGILFLHRLLIEKLSHSATSAVAPVDTLQMQSRREFV